jgi:AcrR family transcriptional regulator
VTDVASVADKTGVEEAIRAADEVGAADEVRTTGTADAADEVDTAGPARVAETNRERISRRQVDKFAERRAQLADAALQTLAELGYARTSLREIAQNSEFSHGVLHYYFSDKQDLLTHCVRQYEAACVTRYDEIVATAGSAEELKSEFSAAMAETLRTDAPMHRLWYDLRNQSLFEESFRADVLEIDQRREEMIWRVLSRYAEFAGITVALDPGAAYAILDGLFQQALLHHLAGRGGAAEDLRTNVVRVLDTLEARERHAGSPTAG